MKSLCFRVKPQFFSHQVQFLRASGQCSNMFKPLWSVNRLPPDFLVIPVIHWIVTDPQLIINRHGFISSILICCMTIFPCLWLLKPYKTLITQCFNQGQSVESPLNDHFSWPLNQGVLVRRSSFFLFFSLLAFSWPTYQSGTSDCCISSTAVKIHTSSTTSQGPSWWWL